MNTQQFQSHLKRLGVSSEQISTLLKIREGKEKLIDFKNRENISPLSDIEMWDRNLLYKRIAFLLEKLDKKNYRFIDEEISTAS